MPTPFDGRSDYGPFIAVGIPSWRSLHRCRGDKDARARRTSTAAPPASPTTPATTKPCDDITNLSLGALDQMSDGVAHATLTYAEDEEVFVGPSRAKTRSSAGVYKEFKGPHARR